MAKKLEELEEWARLLRKENHPLAETMEEIAEGWRKDIIYLLEENESLRDAFQFQAQVSGEGWSTQLEVCGNVPIKGEQG